jgi:5-methylcytosine-specific restriction endonuclease McrA
MNTYGTDTGERFTTPQIDRKVTKAKAEKIAGFIDEHSYVFCEECGVNASNTYIDCSHNISLKEAKETGQAQLCWDVENVTLLCRRCHQKKDKLY